MREKEEEEKESSLLHFGVYLKIACSTSFPFGCSRFEFAQALIRYHQKVWTIAGGKCSNVIMTTVNSNLHYIMLYGVRSNLSTAQAMCVNSFLLQFWSADCVYSRFVKENSNEKFCSTQTLCGHV